METHDREFRMFDEEVLSERLSSFREILFGTRAKYFDALLDTLPTNAQLTALSDLLKKPNIDSVIMTVDGTIAPPYGRIYQEALAKTNGYVQAGRKVAIYPGNPVTPRIEDLRSIGVKIPELDNRGSSKVDFNEICRQLEIDPAHSAMIGSSAITDVPFAVDDERPVFPLNILIQPIPPVRELLEKAEGCPTNERELSRRAGIHHLISNLGSRIIRFNNPTILRSSDFYGPELRNLKPIE